MTELKLAAKLLHLNGVNFKECHLGALAQLEDPSREKVTAILREFEKDEDYVSEFVEELFNLPAPERGDEEVEYGEEEATFFGAEDVPESPLWGESSTRFEYKVVCDDDVRLGGLSNLSVRSDLTVISKLLRRVRYVVTENLRVRSFIRCITDLDNVSAGVELTRSHLSLKTDFEVSTPEMDEMVQFIAEFGWGVFGSKMTRDGGIVALVHRNRAEDIVQNIKDNFGEEFHFFLVFPSRGARRMSVIPPPMPKTVLSESYPGVEELMKKAVQNFEATYRRHPTHGYFAPGSIKILGDHSDYNSTFTLSMALNLVTIVVGALNGSGKIRVATTANLRRQPRKVIFQIPSVKPLVPGKVKWANYVRGIIAYFKGNVPGFDCLIESSIPTGSRVSSSSSLQVALYGFLEELTGQRTEDMNEKVSLCMQAERDFTSTLCGTADFIVALEGRENRLLLVDCKKTSLDVVPFLDSSLVFVLIYRTSYAKPNRCTLYIRLEQCHDVARALGVRSLRGVKQEDLDGIKGLTETAVKRARHIISEKERVLEGAEALRNLEGENLGRLMVESHVSLRDQFEVSSPEVDFIVERAMEVDGVLGARMTGSEYGSSVIALVKKWATDDLIDYVCDTCEGHFNCYEMIPSEGSRALDVKTYLGTLCEPYRTFGKIFE